MKLKRLRENQVLSQRELAGTAGLTHAADWRVENGFGEAYPQTIHKSAGVLRVEPRELAKDGDSQEMGKKGNGEGSQSTSTSGTARRSATEQPIQSMLQKAPNAATLPARAAMRCAAEAHEAMAARDKGVAFDPGGPRVEDYLTQWLEKSVKGMVRPSTYEVHGT